MATAEIEAAIKSIPEKKESLRKAWEVLSSSSPSFVSFNLGWKDIDEYFSALEKSVLERFEELQAKEAQITAGAVSFRPEAKPTPVAAPAPAAEPEATPRPELKTLFAEMDARGLRSFLNEMRKEFGEIQNELTPAIRAAPDPAKLVLDVIDGFYPLKSKGDKDDTETQMIRRTCISLLERVQAIAPEIKPAVRAQAKKLATEWKGKMADSGEERGIEVLGLLQLIVSYNLVSEFEVDEILDLLVVVCPRNPIIDLCKSLGFAERVPDLIQKLNSRGMQLESVKLVYAFNLMEKCPPVPLLNAYVMESKKSAQELKKKGKNSKHSQTEAISRELAALKSVLKAVEVYKLEAEYPRENLVKQIAKLGQLRTDKKWKAEAVAAASNSKTKQQQKPNKRPRGLDDQTPCMGLAGSYSLAATGSLYNYAGPRLSGTPMGLGGLQSPPRSYLYPSESLAGIGGLYDRPEHYGDYTSWGVPPYYGSSLYP